MPPKRKQNLAFLKEPDDMTDCRVVRSVEHRLRRRAAPDQLARDGGGCERG